MTLHCNLVQRITTQKPLILSARQGATGAAVGLPPVESVAVEEPTTPLRANLAPNQTPACKASPELRCSMNVPDRGKSHSSPCHGTCCWSIRELVDACTLRRHQRTTYQVSLFKLESDQPETRPWLLQTEWIGSQFHGDRIQMMPFHRKACTQIEAISMHHPT